MDRTDFKRHAVRFELPYEVVPRDIRELRHSPTKMKARG